MSTAAYATRIRARHSRRTVLTRMTVLHSTRRAYACDPYTGAVVNVLTERPPVHSSGAFPAYPYGMPDVPRS